MCTGIFAATNDRAYKLHRERRGEDGATYVFSILLNKFKGGNAEMKKIQDDVCRAIIDWSGARKGAE